MSVRPRSLVVLGLLLCLAAGLVLRLPGDAVARAMFQSSPLEVTSTPTPTMTVVPATPTATPMPPGSPPQAFPGLEATSPEPPTPFPTPTQAVATAAPTEELPAVPASAAADTPSIPGYLPPPTLTAPDAFPYGRLLPPLENPQRPLMTPDGSEPAPEAGGDAAPVQNRSPLARVVEQVILALGYFWLCCGAIMLAAVSVVFVWLMRRGRPAG